MLETGKRLITVSFLGLSLTASGVCPTTPADWREWSEKASAVTARGALDDDEKPALLLSKFLDRCGGAGVGCLDRLRGFFSVLAAPGENRTMGAVVDDTRYFASVPYPAMLQLPAGLAEPALLDLLDNDDPVSRDEALAKITARSLTAFYYKSNHIKSSDGLGAYGRLFVHVPGKDFDRFLQYTMRDDTSKPLTKTISIVAVQKTDPATGKALPKPRAWFTDLYRERGPGGTEIKSRFEVEGGLESCYGCHKNGVIPIRPDASAFDEKRFRAAVAKVNEAMVPFSASELALVDMKSHGPAMGPRSWPRRTDGFVKECAGGNVTAERRPRIATAMRCARCHEGTDQAVLNWPSGIQATNQSVGKSLVQYYVRDHRAMPLGDSDLTDPERAALFSCLVKEYYGAAGVFETWLRNVDCWNASQMH